MTPTTAEAACLSKPGTDRAGRQIKQNVVAPAGEAARYRAAGYVVEPCAIPIEELRRSVENICRAAATAPAPIQAAIARGKGASLGELCASGRAGLAEMQTAGP